MPKLTKDYIHKFAKTCGFQVSEKAGKYVLKTCYGEYHETSLKDVERHMIKDMKRLNTARF